MWSFFFYSRGLILTYILLLCWLLHNCSSLTAARKRRMVSFGVLSLQHFVRIFFFFCRTIRFQLQELRNVVIVLTYKVLVPVSYQRLMYTYSVTILNAIYSFRWTMYGPGVVSVIDVHVFGHILNETVFFV